MSAQWHPTLCGPMDCSLPGSSVHGILQARVLEWGAISFPTQGLNRGLLHGQVDSLLLNHQGSPQSYHSAGVSSSSLAEFPL